MAVPASCVAIVDPDLLQVLPLFSEEDFLWPGFISQSEMEVNLSVSF